MSAEDFWVKFLDMLNSKLNSISFNTWFKEAKLISFSDTKIVIDVGSKYKKDYIIKFYDDLLDETIQSITGKAYLYEIVTPEELVIEEPKVEEKTNPRENQEYRDINSNLKPKYTFDNFVVGDSNRLAQAVALGVAEQPGKLYNPLFIYGKSGLGKTHLMHAIGNYIKDNSDKVVLYVTCEQFVDDFIGIARRNDDNFDIVKHFKEKYRNIDVLIIDDIQFLGGAPKSQDEFFNTFNFLHDLNKQIIISSDRSPDDLKILELRLRTRFAWGLTVNIMPPDYELKLKIIKNKMAGHEVSTLIKPEVLEYIANNCESDIRHIEGTINRLYACTAMENPKEINLEFAQEALKDYIGSSMYITNNIAKIQKAVAEYFNLTVENLKSKKRNADITNARQIAMYLCKMTTEETIERIGLEFNRNHATVIYACDKVEQEYKTNDNLKQQIREIKDKIAN